MVKAIEKQYYLDVTGIASIKCPEYDEALKALEFHGWTKIVSEPTKVDLPLLKQFYNSLKFYDDGSIGGKVNKVEINITADDYHTVYNLNNTGGYPSTSKKGAGNQKLWKKLVLDESIPYNTQIQRTDMSLKNYLLSAVVHRVYHLAKGSGSSIPFPIAAVLVDLNSSRNINWCQAFFNKLKETLENEQYKHGRVLTGIILHKLGLPLPKEANAELALSTLSFKEYYLALPEPEPKSQTKKRDRTSPVKEKLKKKVKVTTVDEKAEGSKVDSEETFSAENEFEDLDNEEEVSPPRRSTVQVSTSTENSGEEDDVEEVPFSAVPRKKEKGITFREPVVEQRFLSKKAPELSKAEGKKVQKPRSKPSPKKNFIIKKSKSVEQIFAEKKEELRKEIEEELYQSLLTQTREDILQSLTVEDVPDTVRNNISAEIERRAIICLEREAAYRRNISKFLFQDLSAQEMRRQRQQAKELACKQVADLLKLTEEEVTEKKSDLTRSLVSLSRFTQEENIRLSKELTKKERKLTDATELVKPWTLRSLKRNAEKFVKEEALWKTITESMEEAKAALTADDSLSPTDREKGELKLEVLELRSEIRKLNEKNTALQIDVQNLTKLLWRECALTVPRLYKESEKLPYRPATCMLKNHLFHWQSRFSRTVLPMIQDAELMMSSLRPTLTKRKLYTALEILEEPQLVENRQHKLDGTYETYVWCEESSVKWKEVSSERAEQLRRIYELTNAELPEPEPENLDTADQVMNDVFDDIPTQHTTHEHGSTSAQTQQQIIIQPCPPPVSTNQDSDIPKDSLEMIQRSIQILTEKQEQQDREKEEERKRCARLEEEHRKMKEEQQLIRSDQKIVLQNQDSQKTFNDTLLDKINDVLKLFTVAPTVKLPTSTTSVPLTIEESQPVAPIAQSAAPPPTINVSTSTPGTSSSQPPPPTTQALSIPPPPQDDDKRGEETGNEKVGGEEKEQDKASATTPMDIA